MRVILNVEGGFDAGRVFEFDGQASFMVGRSKEAHFRIPAGDKSVSRFHFMVEINPPRCRLVDLGSSNGTKVNGKKSMETELGDGDLITAGRTTIRVVIDQEISTTGEKETLDISANLHGDLLEPPRVKESSSCVLCDLRPALAAERTAAVAAASICPACHEAADRLPQTIKGFLLARELGRGGMGVVYLAVRERDYAITALKMIKHASLGDRRQTGRFLREIEVLQQLDHPNIVALRESAEVDGQLYLAMEYVSGCDALRRLEINGGPLAIGRAVDWVCQMLQALDYAHAKGFVHRDIKPSNVLISEVGGREVVKLADFGLARTYETSPISNLTGPSSIAGTLEYVAPEQLVNLREAKPPVDQFSAAATLYKLLTDRHIHDLPQNVVERLEVVMKHPPIPILSRRADVPPELASIIHRALSRDPAERFAGVLPFRRALLPFLNSN